MPTWSGWEKQFLTTAQVADTTPNQTFMGDWAAHANSSCARNPVDVSHRVQGSRNCHVLNSTRTAQRYQTQLSATGAFAVQLNSNQFQNLKLALKDDRVWNTNDAAGVHDDLVKWGSTQFAAWYQAQINKVTGGTPTIGHDAHAMNGWADLRAQINTGLPMALRRSDRLSREALSQLRRHRKVRG